jgi:hypothetical protein
MASIAEAEHEGSLDEIGSLKMNLAGVDDGIATADARLARLNRRVESGPLAMRRPWAHRLSHPDPVYAAASSGHHSAGNAFSADAGSPCGHSHHSPLSREISLRGWSCPGHAGRA